MERGTQEPRALISTEAVKVETVNKQSSYLFQIYGTLKPKEERYEPILPEYKKKSKSAE
jgi:hypothetical protein